MVSPERDITFINRIVNSPAVRPFVDYTGTSGPLDLAPAVGRATQTGVVWLSNGEDALAAFEITGDREYRGHLFFAETCRGRAALDTAEEMLSWLSRYADRVWGAIPKDGARTRWFASALGFSQFGEDDYVGEGEVILVERMLH